MRNTPQSRLADAAIGALRRRRRRAAARLRRKELAGVTGKTDEEVLEELIGPDWRSVILGEGDEVATVTAEGDGGHPEPSENVGTDGRQERCDDLSARTPIAEPTDATVTIAHAESERTPIATPESWQADDGMQAGW